MIKNTTATALSAPMLVNALPPWIKYLEGRYATNAKGSTQVITKRKALA